MTLPRTSVRHQLLFQHEVLHALLNRVAEAATRTAQGKPAAQELRDAARSLHAVMKAHVEQEERLLAPLLARDERRPHRRDDHRHGLETLRTLRALPACEAAASYLRLVPFLADAMEREDREILEGGPARTRRDGTRNTA
jgi:hypothetical protein